MSELKPQLYGNIYKKEQRTMLITTFVLVLLLVNLAYFLPELKKQKEDYYQLEYTEQLFDNPQYRYRDFLDGTLNMDDIIAKKSVIESNTLHKKDPNNYKYIEKYISDRLAEVGLEPFKFNSVYNFRNSGRNSIILDITLADKEKLTSFISKVSENGFLGKNVSIQKEGGIYNGKVELVFEIK